MVFGGTRDEHIQLNEETLWTGGPYNPVVKGASTALPEIRRLLFAGDVPRAHDLFGRTMMGVPYEQMKYQPLGDLLIAFPGHDSVTSYRRELLLDSALARVSYVVNGVTFTREVFVERAGSGHRRPSTANRPGALTFSATLHGARNPAHSNYGTDYFQMDGVAPNGLRITGKNSDYLGMPGRLTYEARLQARNEGARGTRRSGLSHAPRQRRRRGHHRAGGGDEFRELQGCQRQSGRARAHGARSRRVARRTTRMLRDHVAEHQRWFGRVQLSLSGTSADVLALPTDERITRFATAPDPDLAALYYQFGRYLLIAQLATGHPGGQPAGHLERQLRIRGGTRSTRSTSTSR